MAKRRTSGPRWACSTTWTLRSGRRSTARRPLSFDVEPAHEMEKVLFAADELTGLIGAAARMRPSRSCADMEVSSLKKKFKDKKFAAGCSRDVIKDGAERLGWELEVLMDKTLQAMRGSEAQVAEELASLS